MYFTSSKPIGGRIKFRYSDFVVREIYDNKVAKIIDFDTPQEELYESIPQKTEDYLHFEMQKINQDTQDVIKGLALSLQSGKTKISFAGLKDKRAITSQRFCIYSPDIDLLKNYKKNMIKLHTFSWSDKKVGIGDLEANNFEIVIRNVDLEREEIENIVNSFKEQIKLGIPNKFGEQRFGGVRDISHHVGKLFIRGDIKGAVLLYLSKKTDSENDDIKMARDLVLEQKYSEAIKKFPKKGFRFERAILNSLIKNPNDFLNAWGQLPNNLQYLFTHAYQSYLFNLYVDKRLNLLGSKFFEAQKFDVLDENCNILGSLFGYESEKLNYLEKEILESEGFSLKDFKVKNFPLMSVSGSFRKIKLEVYDFKLVSIDDDEFNDNRKKVTISFTLDKGNYATVVMDELLKVKL